MSVNILGNLIWERDALWMGRIARCQNLLRSSLLPGRLFGGDWGNLQAFSEPPKLTLTWYFVFPGITLFGSGEAWLTRWCETLSSIILHPSISWILLTHNLTYYWQDFAGNPMWWMAPATFWSRQGVAGRMSIFIWCLVLYVNHLKSSSPEYCIHLWMFSYVCYQNHRDQVLIFELSANSSAVLSIMFSQDALRTCDGLKKCLNKPLTSHNRIQS